MVPSEPFKNKVFKLKKQDPGKRSLPGRPFQAQDHPFGTRPWQEELARKAKTWRFRRLVVALRAPRQGPEGDKLPGAAR